jgi:hypothetical protein
VEYHERRIGNQCVRDLRHHFWTHSCWSNPDTAGAAVFSSATGFTSPAGFSVAAEDACAAVFAGSGAAASAIASELAAASPVAMIREMIVRMILPF